MKIERHSQIIRLISQYDYLNEALKLELSDEKTLITNAQKPAKFLGYDGG